MTDNTSGVRRMKKFHGNVWVERNDGTHHLTKIDDYVPVKRETWERVIRALRLAGCHHIIEELPCVVCEVLAEIGGEDE